LHERRVDALPERFLKLQEYLLEMLEDCPDHYFQEGPRSSKLNVDLGIEPHEVPSHPVTLFAQEGLEWDQYKTAHSNVQVYMLYNDPQTLCVEAPIWMETDAMLTGHIDLLRFSDDAVWVWDYKPGAADERYATTQTFAYALMLSTRTGIPLDQFRCGYFDDETSYIYQPKLAYAQQLTDAEQLVER
jgi:hypothetical protein